MHFLTHVFHLARRRSVAWLLLSITVMFLALAINPVFAQQGNQVDGYPVTLDGEILFRIRQGIPGVVNAEERAQVIDERVRDLANSSIPPESIRMKEEDNASVVLAGDEVLYTVRESDRVGNLSRRETAANSVSLLKSAISKYRQDRSFKQILQSLLLAVLGTISLLVFLVLVQRAISRLLIRIKAARRADELNLRIQNFQLLGSNATGYLLEGILRALRLVIILMGFYIYIPFVLSQFPATRAIGRSIFDDIAARLNQLGITFVQYLPNLATIAIISLFTYYLIQFAKLVISELGRHDVYPWFYPEWIEPTERLATILLIVLACIIAAPYLPGFNSPAFQGVSLLLGALFTLGSSSAVSNAIAGIILIYTRAFRVGDIIRIGDTTGEVLEKSLLVTRLITFKKEVITVPNGSVLSSNVVNFNAVSREAKNHLVLHTTITLGYDVPWRKIHEVLIAAAEVTEGILREPSPFVLQTALNDFNVSYELNAYTNDPRLMSRIYSELHQNIQDHCNGAGIEILSPGYSSIRDGNHSTIPSDYLPPDYKSPSFGIQYPDERF